MTRLHTKIIELVTSEESSAELAGVSINTRDDGTWTITVMTRPPLAEAVTSELDGEDDITTDKSLFPQNGGG